jgi:hypothetical protein
MALGRPYFHAVAAPPTVNAISDDEWSPLNPCGVEPPNAELLPQIGTIQGNPIRFHHDVAQNPPQTPSRGATNEAQVGSRLYKDAGGYADVVGIQITIAERHSNSELSFFSSWETLLRAFFEVSRPGAKFLWIWPREPEERPTRCRN